MASDLATRFESAPYVRALGLRVDGLESGRALVRVPFTESNANPGGALHGGVAASAVGIAGALAAWSGASVAGDAGHGAVATEGRLLDLSVVYLAAAIAEDVVADARVLRRGKEIVYADVEVRNDEGKAIARGAVTYRIGPPGRAQHQRRTAAPSAAAAVPDAATAGDPSPGELPAFARFFTAAPFMARLGLAPRAVHDGTAVVALPWRGANADADAGIHDGAVAALADTAAAMAAWSLVPLDPRNKASTVGLHVSHIGRPAGIEVLAEARVLARDDEIFPAAVTLTGGGTVVATASVTYRIVTP